MADELGLEEAFRLFTYSEKVKSCLMLSFKAIEAVARAGLGDDAVRKVMEAILDPLMAEVRLAYGVTGQISFREVEALLSSVAKDPRPERLAAEVPRAISSVATAAAEAAEVLARHGLL